MGKSDFSGSGKITGYLGFALGKEETLAGKMDFKSKFIDLNAFMTDTGETVPEDTTSFSVIPVPANINLIFNAEADRIQFMDFNLAEAMGTVQLREGIARLTGVKFNLLDGAFAMTGTYDPRNLQRPLYDFDMGIDKLSIQSAAQGFSLVKKIAPIAGADRKSTRLNSSHT